MAKTKNDLNKFTWDLDWFDDKSYNDDLSQINNTNSTLENRVTNVEWWLWTLSWRVNNNETDISNIQNDLLPWITQTVVVKNWAGVNINLNFTKWILTSIT